MRGLGDPRDQPVEEDYLELIVIHECLHMHLPNVGMVGEIVGQGAVMCLPYVRGFRRRVVYAYREEAKR